MRQGHLPWNLGHLDTCPTAGWSEREAFETHPLALKIQDATIPHSIKNIDSTDIQFYRTPVLQCMVTDDHADEASRDLDVWLLSLTEERWAAGFDEEVEGMGDLRRWMLIKGLDFELQHLRKDSPDNKYLSTDVGFEWMARTSAAIEKAVRGNPPPIWALCDIAATIAGRRHQMEWFCGQILAREKTMICLEGIGVEDPVFEWLHARWGKEIWPNGKPTTWQAAQAMLGSTKAKRKEITARSLHFRKLTSVLMKSKKLPNAVELKENNDHKFQLDNDGWNYVASSIPSDESPSTLSPCIVEGLDVFSKRQAELHKADKFLEEIPKGAVSNGNQSGLSPKRSRGKVANAVLYFNNGDAIFIARQLNLAAGTELHADNAVGMLLSQRDVPRPVQK
ncbi:hypothetical protein IMSHALPRED_004576 [Imshaugia aleurites]|uniref:Uncharacterized protein n=1 Tax=Imshaugia aleurites TaxID=172621 RepID=A0A8H3FEA7_9LECA|nr:hypothetical protein IMSHALPRED_004576 [Imshaugia aleurites]